MSSSTKKKNDKETIILNLDEIIILLNELFLESKNNFEIIDCLYGLNLLSINLSEEVEINQISTVYDIEKKYIIPFAREYFDVVTMLAVFEHLEPKKIVRILNEIYRILRPGGMYIVTTPAAWTNGLLRFIANLRLVSPIEIEEHKDSYSHSRISSMLQKKANFRKDNLRFGYFEIFMNIWVTATK